MNKKTFEEIKRENDFLLEWFDLKELRKIDFIDSVKPKNYEAIKERIVSFFGLNSIFEWADAIKEVDRNIVSISRSRPVKNQKVYMEDFTEKQQLLLQELCENGYITLQKTAELLNGFFYTNVKKNAYRVVHSLLLKGCIYRKGGGLCILCGGYREAQKQST